MLAKVEPIWEEFEGWMTDTSHCKTYDQLPPQTRKYVERISTAAGVPLGLVSVGPNRDQTIVLAKLLD